MKRLKDFEEKKIEMSNITGGWDSYGYVWHAPGGESTPGNYIVKTWSDDNGVTKLNK